jgi:Ca2+-binding RTX toxin-like protein
MMKRRALLLLVTMGAAIIAASGVALALSCTADASSCEGTPKNNRIHGTDSSDQIFGQGGSDIIYGNGGGDNIWGDWHQVVDPGEPGSDTIYGGRGPDRLQGDERTDTLNGGPGNDRIEAKDGESDIIDCGRGTEDIAFFDKRGVDEVSNCEVRNPPVG